MLRAHRALRGRRGAAVPRTVVLLGLCSLLTDVSSEMVATVLPLYLVATLGFTPLQFGVVDGLYQGAGAFVRLGAGFLGDRLRRHKEVAALGYGLSAVCKLALAAVGSAFGAISAIVLADRAGKGIRTAPRDAMISLATPEERLGASFGVHRAMDTAGAMIGPLVAFGLLALTPGEYTSLFLVAFLFGLVGLAVLVLLVDDPSKGRGETSIAPPPKLRDVLALLRVPAFRGLSVAALALGLATVSDGFIYLTLQQRLDLDPAYFPLLFTGTAVVYMALAAPAGRLADRVGRGRVLLGGYLLLLAVYCLLIAPSLGIAGLCLTLVLLGTYYAATDGVRMALASAWVPKEIRGSGLAALGTAVSGARLLASVIFGAVWTIMSSEIALTCFAVGLVAALFAAAIALRPTVVARVG
jgi:MFS family permease